MRKIINVFFQYKIEFNDYFSANIRIGNELANFDTMSIGHSIPRDIVAMLYLMEIQRKSKKKTWYTPICGVGAKAPPHMFYVKT